MTKVTKNTIKAMIRKQGSVKVNMLPCKIKLGNMWVVPCEIEIKTIEELEIKINEFVYYNCNSEMGYYPAYYIIEGDK